MTYDAERQPFEEEIRIKAMDHIRQASALLNDEVDGVVAGELDGVLERLTRSIQVLGAIKLVPKPRTPPRP
jgi:hypothetical protein